MKALDDAKLKPANIDEVVLVGGSTRMPRVQQIVKDIFGKEPHKGVNPDEVVAVGAAIQGAVLTGEVKEVLLLDVTPLSLGLETKGNVMTVLVPQEHHDPDREEGSLHHGRRQPDRRHDQGLPGRAADGARQPAAGRIQPRGHSARPHGRAQDRGRVQHRRQRHLERHGPRPGNRQGNTIHIQSSGGLDKDEIERMKRDAESHAADDKKRRELAEARNTAEQRVYQLEKLVEEHKDKLSESDQSALQAAIDKVNEAKKQDDVAAINRAVDELQRASQAMAEHLYAGAKARAGPGPDRPRARRRSPNGGHGAKPEDVIDVEFEEKK